MKLSSRIKHIILAVFASAVAILTFDYVKTTVLHIYYFNFRPTSMVPGYVLKKEQADDLQGARSFGYTVAYKVNNTTFKLQERLSPDSVTLSLDQSIPVKHSIQNPRLATIKNNSSRWTDLGIAAVLIFLIITMFTQVYRGFKYDIDVYSNE